MLFFSARATAIPSRNASSDKKILISMPQTYLGKMSIVDLNNYS